MHMIWILPQKKLSINLSLMVILLVCVMLQTGKEWIGVLNMELLTTLQMCFAVGIKLVS